jgi:hypothetical protein
MDIFSFVVLENTLEELATLRIRPEENSRLDECTTVIRACMQLIATNPANGEYTRKIQQALTELSVIARKNGEFIIAARLRTIVLQLDPTDQLDPGLARGARATP